MQDNIKLDLKEIGCEERDIGGRNSIRTIPTASLGGSGVEPSGLLPWWLHKRVHYSCTENILFGLLYEFRLSLSV